MVTCVCGPLTSVYYGHRADVVSHTDHFKSILCLFCVFYVFVVDSYVLLWLLYIVLCLCGRGFVHYPSLLIILNSIFSRIYCVGKSVTKD